jgi:hypothetical protein
MTTRPTWNHAPTVLLAVSVMILASGSATAGVLLFADFEAVAPGEVLGTGGPLVGEPVSISSSGLLATIDGVAMGSHSLRLEDTGTWGTAVVRFEFLPPYQIGAGTVSLSMDLLFPALESYSIRVRERGTSACTFGEVWFEDTGRFGLLDTRGFAGYVGIYRPGIVEHLELVYDMTTGTYDVLFNGVVVLNDRAHGANADCDVGALLIGPQHDADIDGVFFVDNILVDVPEVVPNANSTWGTVKAAFR